jgi:hypothetical protein
LPLPCLSLNGRHRFVEECPVDASRRLSLKMKAAPQAQVLESDAFVDLAKAEGLDIAGVDCCRLKPMKALQSMSHVAATVRKNPIHSEKNPKHSEKKCHSEKTRFRSSEQLRTRSPLRATAHPSGW